MTGAPVLTVREALAEFRHANNLPTDDSVTRSWTCGLGPVTIRLPNFKWRRSAIVAHDLHHVLTGYPCTLRGECQMAAWEFAAGRMPHWAARLFCLPLIPLGLIWSPRATASAFLAGGRSQSLHGVAPRESLLDAPLDSVRRSFPISPVPRWLPRDRVRFALLILEAGLVAFAPMALIAASWLAFDGVSW